MPKVHVVLKSGAKIEVEGADEADWREELRFPGAEGQQRFTVRLVCKLGDRVVARFDGSEVAGYAVDLR